MSGPSIMALIPARAGSLRVPSKNIRRLEGHPLIAYSIAATQATGLFTRIVVSTDSPEISEIASHYGAEVPFLRPAELASATSPDIEWIKHAFTELQPAEDAFAIIRPTSPFRTAETIRRGYERFAALSGIDSLRAVQLCKEHPGKMWIVEGDTMHPLLEQSHLEVAWHAGQYQALPAVYVQNSSLEIAWCRVVRESGTREGERIAPFISEDVEGFSIDTPSEWALAEMMTRSGEATLPPVPTAPWGTDG